MAKRKEPENKGAAEVKDLSARRNKQLVEENSELKAYVAEVMQRLRDNERLFSRLFELESEVLAATDPEDLCFVLMRNLRANFDLDLVRFWFDRASFMGARQMDAISERDLVWIEKGEIEDMGLHRKQVHLVNITPNKGFEWLESRDQPVKSLALLTLGDAKKPFGVLGMGSIDPERFQPGQSTDFLQHLAQVVGLSLENAVARERLARLAITDTLTGTHNRRFLQPHSHQPLSQWFGKGNSVACLYIDVDDFRGTNERLGHAAADELLAAICDTARRQVRSQDPMVRMGGDEFILLLSDCAMDKVQTIAGRVVSECGKIEAGGDTMSVSVGIAFSAPAQDMRVRELIDAADRAMYVAKALGGGRIEIAEQDDADKK